jgi:2-C-methyl-D-erythritol 4-phosphate cytidylyltransferase
MNSYSIIIPAGGIGSRLKNYLKGESKQFVKLIDKSVLEIVIEKFFEYLNVRELIISLPFENFEMNSEYFFENIKVKDISKIKIVKGGKTRQESVFNALNSCVFDTGKVLIHDAARPFFSKYDLQNLIEVAEKKSNAILAVLAKDSVRLAENQITTSAIDRTKVWLIQTPQIFEIDILKKAYIHAKNNNFVATDDSMIIEHYGQKIYIVEGSYENFKITTPFDFEVAKMLLLKKLNQDNKKI